MWGSLLFVSFIMACLSDGPGAAFARLDPQGEPGLFPWINAACALLAPLAWVSLAALALTRKRE